MEPDTGVDPELWGMEPDTGVDPELWAAVAWIEQLVKAADQLGTQIAAS